MNMTQRSEKTAPTHAHLKITPNGNARRPDGLYLTPIENSPHYVIATAFGEQTGDTIDWDLHEQNRRIWNGWACSEMNKGKRKELAKTLGWPLEMLEPLSDDERKILQDILNDRLGENTEIPSPKDNINLARVYTQNNLVFEKYLFLVKIAFQNSTFVGHTYFQNAKFRQRCDFSNVEFLDQAIFQNTSFSGQTYFNGATFYKHADFSHLTCTELAVFQSASFHEYADFANATFTNYAEFEGVSFHGNAEFPNVQFAESADFENTTFSATVNFKKAAFSGNTMFSNATFETTAAFAHCAFLTEVPRFYKTTLHPDTHLTISPAYWPEINSENAERSKPAYIRLRQIMTENNKPEEEHFFHRRQLKCQSYLTTGINRWTNKMFELFSDYGYSIARPLRALGACILVPVLIYMFYFAETDDHGLAEAFIKGVGVSFSSTFNIFGFLRNIFPKFLEFAPFWIDALCIGQMFFGTILILLLGLGLRSQFRIR